VDRRGVGAGQLEVSLISIYCITVSEKDVKWEIKCLPYYQSAYASYVSICSTMDSHTDIMITFSSRLLRAVSSHSSIKVSNIW